MRNFFKLILCIFLVNCSLIENKKIEVTNEYLLNENWDEDIIVCVEQMKIKKDSVLNIFDSRFNKNLSNHWNITNKLEIDSLHRYNIFIEKQFISNNEPKKVYFNKYNGSKWREGCYGLNKTIGKTIGNLKNKTWYKFSKLKSLPYFKYVYLDSVGEVHSFDQDLSNY